MGLCQLNLLSRNSNPEVSRSFFLTANVLPQVQIGLGLFRVAILLTSASDSMILKSHNLFTCILQKRLRLSPVPYLFHVVYFLLPNLLSSTTTPYICTPPNLGH